MRNTILFNVLLLIPAFGFSQHWSLLNESKVTFFKHSDSAIISNTIVIDSVKTIGGIKSYFTGSEVKPCLTCANTQLVYKFAPEFLGFEITEDTLSDAFVLNGNIIKPTAVLSASWAFNTSVTATVSGVGDSLVFGVLDSVKTISLSSGETILISKNNGIIQYPDFENAGTHFSQTGYHQDQNSKGEYLPNFWSTYNFNVGDVFCYDIEAWAVDDRSEYWVRMEVLSKIQIGDSIIYTMKILSSNQFTYNLAFPEYSYTLYSKYNYIDTLTCVNNENHILNTFGLNHFSNQFITDWSTGQSFFMAFHLEFNQGFFTDTLLVSNQSNLGQFGIAKQGFIFMNYADSTLAPFSSYGITLSFNHGKGIGMISKRYFNFEHSHELNLIGAIKNGDTIGTIYNYPDDLGVQKQSHESLKVYPNPAQQILYVPANAVRTIVYSLSGLIVLERNLESQQLDVSDLENGMYIIQVMNEAGEMRTGKFLKE